MDVQRSSADGARRSARAPGSASATRTDSSIAAGCGRGLPRDVFDGRPVIGICNTWSELTPVQRALPRARRARQARRLGSGRPAVRVPGHLARRDQRPADGDALPQPRRMDVEESIRANPIDGVVLLCGCDKTTPSLVMGAASCDLPAIVVSGGPMLNGKYRGRDIGVSHVWKFSEDVKAGAMTRAGVHGRRAVHVALDRHLHGDGHGVTMAIVVDALGLALPHNAEIPAVDSRRYALAHEAGRRIVDMVVRRRAAVEDPDARGVRERDPRQRRGRRLDQRRDPPAGDGRPRRRAADARRLGSPRPRRADAGRPHAVGPLHDGGLLLRRRPAAGHAHAGRARACCTRTR